MFGWDNKRVGIMNGTASSPSADNGTIQHRNSHIYGTSSTLPLPSISQKKNHVGTVGRHSTTCPAYNPWLAEQIRQRRNTTHPNPSTSHLLPRYSHQRRGFRRAFIVPTPFTTTYMRAPFRLQKSTTSRYRSLCCTCITTHQVRAILI